MTPPVITFDAARHRYTLDGEPVPSVTQILGIIDKSGPLSWWGQSVGVQGVCTLRSQLGDEMPWDDPEGIVKLLTSHKITVNHVKHQAGTRGTSLHDALEAYVRLGTVPNVGDYPEEDRGFVMALARALLELQPAPIDIEVVVGSREHGFAGRFDLLAVIQGVITRLDLKTSKRVYPESMFPQLEAYEFAAVECGMESSERRCVLRLGADGEFEFVESTATFEDFLAVKAAYDAVGRIKKAAKVAA